MDIRVKRVDAMLPCGVIDIGHKVTDGGLVGESNKAVSDAFGNVESAPINIIKQDRIPLAEGRRTDTNVDDEIEHGPARGGHVLGLTGWNIREVDAPD